MNILITPRSASRAKDLFAVAQFLVRSYGGKVLVLDVVEVPASRSLSEGALQARRLRTALRKMIQPGAFDFPVEVRTSYSFETSVRDSVHEQKTDLLLIPSRQHTKSKDASVATLLLDPPCDVAMIKSGALENTESVMVPARGGPQARLALQIAEAAASSYGAPLTLLHVTSPRWTARRRQREDSFFQAVRDVVSYANVRELQVESSSVEDVLVSEGAKHDVVVMGAGARDERSAYQLGEIPERVARRIPGAVIIAKTREPVTANTFDLDLESLQETASAEVSEVVDRWFAENTFHSHEFRDIDYLLTLKERQGVTISVALPTLNEEKTVGRIISTIKRSLMEERPLVDEMIVIDSDSDDRTVEIATNHGIPVFKHPDILASQGTFAGKGEALWKSLQVTKGDIVVWIDSDITSIHPKFVYGLLGPLLTQPKVGFVKGFYRRPLKLAGELLTTGGGRVTELTARPLINLFYPQLSGLVQPLAGEMAGRRDVLESVPFFTGYGVETGLLIDILEHHGLSSIAQTDLELRIHRNQSLLSLSKMAFAIVQVVVKRLGDRKRLHLVEDMNRSMKLIHYSTSQLFLEVKEIEEHERPPIFDLAEYRNRGRGS